MDILFINGSSEKNGNTAMLAKQMLAGKEYETLMLPDYRVNVFGQTLPGDQFEEILSKVEEAKTIVIGSPLYWHNICGSVRTFIDRFYGTVESGELSGKKLAFIFQGAAPEKWMLEAGDFTMKRFAGLYGMTYLGMVTNKQEAKKMMDRV